MSEIVKFAIEVEKQLCSKLNKEWQPVGMSIETLIDELAARTKLSAAGLSVDAGTKALPILRILALVRTNPSLNEIIDNHTLGPAMVAADEHLEKFRALCEGLAGSHWKDLMSYDIEKIRAFGQTMASEAGYALTLRSAEKNAVLTRDIADDWK